MEHVSNKNMLYELLQAFHHLSNEHHLFIALTLFFLVKPWLYTISICHSIAGAILRLNITLLLFYRFSTEKLYNFFPLKINSLYAGEYICS